MITSFGENVLSVFDVRDDARDFLRDIIESDPEPLGETRWLLNQSLLATDEDWHYLIECAKSIQQSHYRDAHGLEGIDVLTYVCHIFNRLDCDSAAPPEGWEKTDRLILLAKELAKDPIIRPPSLPTRMVDDAGVESRLPHAKRRRSVATTSHSWSDATPTQASGGEATHANVTTPIGLPFHANPVESSLAVRPRRLAVSPYFSTAPSTPVRTSPKQPPAGTVSCVPFPPLSSPFFGIIQERVAHEPLWLLIAVTFLIKTKGRLAIPVFYEVKGRFPTPSQLADPANAQELSDMIRQLGLAVVRVVYIQRYAKAFLDQPPRPDVRYRVRNYDGRDIGPSHSGLEGFSDAPNTDNNDDGDPEAWEIGHMTKGAYALDSWRIFCRDELLGRAEDWNGKGREPEFQPEWMRVMPQDKELRAYLRWMWMREGWEWDPVTGERTVLREEMRRAVDEGRVEYDDTGGLRTLDEPRIDETSALEAMSSTAGAERARASSGRGRKKALEWCNSGLSLPQDRDLRQPLCRILSRWREPVLLELVKKWARRHAPPRDFRKDTVYVKPSLRSSLTPTSDPRPFVPPLPVTTTLLLSSSSQLLFPAPLPSPSSSSSSSSTSSLASSLFPFRLPTAWQRFNSGSSRPASSGALAPSSRSPLQRHGLYARYANHP
ncbi:Methyl-CpG-binding domain protein 4 [Tolypocladium ophioglossoides CBS 100239]|uniref:Methyl-CpG-binding domain protein 4 n=1 Tax=Tolypocladium ophioglossoides (strain CBS 100239) TaxID=1163406 RepID=A0A0L0NLN6_TOLOC|nr:Methyl-CpG-binding domain protein 4 [Tolypocladium ophioglossoides CBS 100239]